MTGSRLRAAAARQAHRLGGTRWGVWTIGHVVSPLQRRLYLRTGGRFSLTGSAPVLLLTSTGRRSGLQRTVPLLYVEDGDDRLVVCNVNPGFERTNPWVLNLRADPRATVQVRRDVYAVSAREATPAEVELYWPALTALWPAYERFYARGGKRTAFVLHRSGEPRTLPRGTGPV